MNNKVTELVEWASLTTEEMQHAILDYPDIPMGQAVAKAQLDKAYSHPDLALIERGIPYIGKEQDEKARLQVLPVIPLAEALKESNGHKRD